MNATTFTFEDILDAIMLKVSEPTYATLVEWVMRFPEHQKQLENFFATWAIQKELPEEAVVDEEAVANRAMSHALEVLRRHSDARRVAQLAKRNIRLIAAAQRAGVSVLELASRAGLDELLVIKLDRRLLRNIPAVCFERLGRVLTYSVDQVRSMVTGPPIAARAHKAKGPLSIGTEEFVDAIHSSSLSREAKEFWLAAIEDERSDSSA